MAWSFSFDSYHKLIHKSLKFVCRSTFEKITFLFSTYSRCSAEKILLMPQQKVFYTIYDYLLCGAVKYCLSVAIQLIPEEVESKYLIKMHFIC